MNGSNFDIVNHNGPNYSLKTESDTDSDARKQ